MIFNDVEETIMRQAGHTAEYWADRAFKYADANIGGLTLKHEKIPFVAAFMVAAALDQLAMTYRDLNRKRKRSTVNHE